MPAGTSIHMAALDNMLNVNSLFTLAVFVGLAWNPWDPNNTLNKDPSCIPGANHARGLVAFHVYSFSCFLFSSLIALSLKNAIRISRTPSCYPNEFLPRIDLQGLQVGMLVSSAGAVSGCIFMMLALVNLVQIKLGTVACGNPHSIAAILPLVILIPISLVIYVGCVMFAFAR